MLSDITQFSWEPSTGVSRRREDMGEETTDTESCTSELTAGEIWVDWRGRTCTNSSKHGGTRAALFVLGLLTFEMMAVAAVGNNLITYVFNDMHFSLSKSANIVTNFIGTIFLLSLLGGFLSDSYLGSFWTMLIFGFVEFSGFILLSLQAHLPNLKPRECNMMTEGDHCLEPKGFQAAIFFAAIYLVALGSGCLKPNMISHGADQFRNNDPNQARKLSTFFNTAYFSFCLGELIALTVCVWIQTRYGMDIGFGVSTTAMGIGLLSLTTGLPLYRNKPPQGSIFTLSSRIPQPSTTKKKQIRPSGAEIRQGNLNDGRPIPTDAHRSPSAGSLCEDKSSSTFAKNWEKIQEESPPHHMEGGVSRAITNEDRRVKTIISVIPIFACTIIFNTILAQLQTLSVQQGSTMDARLTDSFEIPPASLQSIPYIMLMALVPLYEVAFVPFVRKISGKGSGISELQRIGIGLFTVTFSMVSAALVEKERRELSESSTNSNRRKLSIFWIAPQFLIFGVSEMFTAVGFIEFFYKQPLEGMRSFLTAMTYCSYSFGFYLSSLLVSAVNKITSGKNKDGWLGSNDLNKDRLDLFYWMLAVLSLFNFFNYLFWSRWYSSRTVSKPSTYKATARNLQG